MGSAVVGGMSNVLPSTRSRVWNLLRTARAQGRAGVTVTALGAVLGASPEVVMGAVMADMLDTPAGESDPALYCDPSGEGGPVLTPRRFPDV